MRKLIVALIVIAVIILSWQVYQKTFSTKKKSVSRGSVTIAVEVTPIVKTSISEVGVFTGTLLPDSQFTVAPKISAKLEKIMVDIGDRVTRGQLVAVLDDDEYVQQVDQARAELDVARANIEENRSALDLAQREFERAKALREKKIVSVAELDAAEAQYKAARAKQKVAVAQVAQKDAELKTAQVRLGYTRIRAAWENGHASRVVGERFVDEGAMLTANAPIASIIDIHVLKAVIHVIERDYPRMKPGQAALVTTDAYPGKTFKGVISRIAPLLKEAARQARVEIEIPNPGELLKPGMFVRVKIEFDRHDHATVVPVNALTKHGGEWGVFIVDEKAMQARLVPVKIGIRSGDLVEILDPAVSGIVVIVGQHLLEDGSAVTLPAEKEDSSAPGTVEAVIPNRGT